jgi:hypothetical protein
MALAAAAVAVVGCGRSGYRVQEVDELDADAALDAGANDGSPDRDAGGAPPIDGGSNDAAAALRDGDVVDATALDGGATMADGGATTADGGATTADGGATTADGGATTADGGRIDSGSLPAPDGGGGSIAGPVLGHWSFETITSGTTLLDVSGAGRDATCAGTECPVPTAGAHGGALFFDGSSDILRVPFDPGLAVMSTAFTVAAWVASAAPPTHFENIAAVPFGTALANSWAVFVDSTRVCLLSRGTYICAPRGAVVDGAFHHVAATWDGAEGVLYVDGVEVARGGIAGITFDAAYLVLGADLDRDRFVYGWHGAIDDVGIYARALSPTEIGTLSSM